MTELTLRMLAGATAGLMLALLLRRPARRAFGAGPAFALWLLPVALALAPLLPRGLAPGAAAWALPAVVVAPHVAAAGRTTAVDWSAWAVGIWWVGVALGGVRLAWGYARLRHGARRVPCAWRGWLVRSLSGADARRVRTHPAGPAVLWSLPHSLLLLPTDFPERPGRAATRELVLRHELTHLRRGDPWWTLAMEITSVLLWFHPLAWFARPRFRLDQELACDAAALRAAPLQAASYARALLDSVAVQAAPALIPWLTEPQLKERIAMLAQRVPGAVRRRAGFLAIAVLVGGGLYLAGGQLPLAAATTVTTPPTVPGKVTGHAASGTTPASVDVSYKNRNPPRYPVDAVRNGEQGTVILKVTVGATGNVTHLAIDPQGTTAPQQLQAAALLAAGGWKFNPGHADGRAVGGVVTIPVKFSLQGDNGKSYVPPCGTGSQYVAPIKQCVKLVQPARSAG